MGVEQEATYCFSFLTPARLFGTSALLSPCQGGSLKPLHRKQRGRRPDDNRTHASSVALMFCSQCGRRLPSLPPTACETCGASHRNDPRSAGGALVVANDELLFVRRASEPWEGFWDLPAGFCEEAEHPAETAKREVQEEAGLPIALTGFLGMWVDEYRPASRERPPEYVLRLYFTARPETTIHASPDHEVAKIAWYPRDSLPSDIAFRTTSETCSESGPHEQSSSDADCGGHLARSMTAACTSPVHLPQPTSRPWRLLACRRGCARTRHDEPSVCARREARPQRRDQHQLGVPRRHARTAR